MKAVSISWLVKTDLSNLNAGENAGNLTELKRYHFDSKPYVSGQSIRRALFDTIQRSYPDRFLCSPETPCGDVENCWSCDLRGYLAPEEGTGGTRRWSPIKSSPALGQVASDIVNDLLTRHSDLEKENKQSKDNRIAHVQMTENIYRCNIVLDLANIGVVHSPIIEEKKGSKGKSVVRGYQKKLEISREEKITRVHAVLDSIYHLSGFAKQARSASSLAPEIMVLALQDTYNQRGLSVLDLNGNGEMDLGRLEITLKEHQLLGNKLVIGWTPGIVANEQSVLEIFEKYHYPVMTVLEGIIWAKEQISDYK